MTGLRQRDLRSRLPKIVLFQRRIEAQFGLTIPEAKIYILPHSENPKSVVEVERRAIALRQFLKVQRCSEQVRRSFGIGWLAWKSAFGGDGRNQAGERRGLGSRDSAKVDGATGEQSGEAKRPRIEIADDRIMWIAAAVVVKVYRSHC